VNEAFSFVVLCVKTQVTKSSFYKVSFFESVFDDIVDKEVSSHKLGESVLLHLNYLLLCLNLPEHKLVFQSRFGSGLFHS